MENKSLNSNLHKANKAKKDEFYTQLIDIEKELKYYKEQFKNKIVYCNCDDPFESNFFKYFASNFNALGLKRLIATSYKPSPIANTQLGLFGEDKTLTTPKGRPKTTANKFIINEVSDIDGDGAFDLRDIAQQLKANKNNEWTPLKSDGDFRSPESIELLKQADIVVTNPPFSLFREYVAQLVEYGKKFLILGQQGAVIYKEFLPLIKENKVWLGYDNGGTKWFQVPIDYDIPTESRKKIENGIKFFSMGSVNWYTNLDVAKRHEFITLYKKYSPLEYPKYDNYDAINVNYKAEIPMNYDGVMGVPITFLDNHNPDQFEIIGLDRYTGKNGDKDFTINGKMLFRRLLIKNKKPQK
ncbi:MAG: Modification methylase EcoRI [Parcubacteria group bacterium GW2011_GWB1_36_5]|nr:MAG: Modification methylase EcoRI [Parcubacteria group bacterium GW2011_GWA2_36_24]KKQ07922.1 MAG: Modification methylase EcoRI [Parcubacteria group bacterium GW2011_GWB1_36_5]